MFRVATRAVRRIPSVRFGSTANGMFCYQCEQTLTGTGCSTVGICGKSADVAALQDVLVQAVKGISTYVTEARKLGATDNSLDRWIMQTAFMTMTNVNFDLKRHTTQIEEAKQNLAKAIEMYKAAASAKGEQPTSFDNLNEWSTHSGTFTETLDEAVHVGIVERLEGEDPNVFGVKELICYGLKGIAAYAEHAARLGQEDPEVFAFITEGFAKIAQPMTLEEGVALTLECGRINFRVMELLDAGHCSNYGNPEPTHVNRTPKPGKCILVSGHDIHDVEAVLKATEGTGINVYTHGELLPANTYPELKKYSHLAGHYGRAWQAQRVDFTKFPGPILMTTNCLMPPAAGYMKRLYTTQVVGTSGAKHISDGDFSGLVQHALELPGFPDDIAERMNANSVLTGFGKNALGENLPALVDLIKAGKLKHVFVIGGCDGTEHDRNYFGDMARNTPSDSIVVALGCGKYRYLFDDLGTVGDTDVPRVLDVGQCNDAYSAIIGAVALKDALGLASVNDLPIHFAVSWFEQKAVAVLCTLLYLGVRNIHLGPKLPAFLTPAVTQFLVDNFALAPTGDRESADVDLQKFLAAPNNQ
eukprot:NODE_131_length_2174_cov_84.408403_g108_i0.p1 GENE.NODE_131_length_2174_cov_84.408403_g108_i0~~NODE_131_length_2174_cov_84.408403_g108_i0.p1  ORF type:complete len:586 (-),score=160.97 NODE_131_length_2174_cov_84.408403_g108_i0:342-2099(-)